MAMASNVGTTAEQQAWEKTAIENEVVLGYVNLHNTGDMEELYEMLDVTGVAAKSRLRAFIAAKQHHQQQDFGTNEQTLTFAAAATRQSTYTLEIILENQAADLSKSGVVITGWRRENDATTRPNLYLRPHLIEKKKELDAFFHSANKRLYVSGPPGSGKTSFFLLFCASRALALNQRALVVQYRDTSQCEIIIIDGTNICRVALNAGLNRENLLAVLKLVVEEQTDIAFFMFDGVRQKVQACGDVLAFLNARFAQSKGIHITSLQFTIKGGDGTFTTDQYMQVLSWELLDYVNAYRSGLLTKPQWLNILEDSEKKQKEDCEDGNNDDDQMSDSGEETTDAGDEGEEEFFMALLERKFYYAGGSARFMLECTLRQLMLQTLPVLLGRMTSSLWDDFSQLNIQANSETTVNSLMQVVEGKGTLGTTVPVSKYVLHKAYEKCGGKLVKSVKAAADATDNPALSGWAFELSQIECINTAMRSN